MIPDVWTEKDMHLHCRVMLYINGMYILSILFVYHNIQNQGFPRFEGEKKELSWNKKHVIRK